MQQEICHSTCKSLEICYLLALVLWVWRTIKSLLWKSESKEYAPGSSASFCEFVVLSARTSLKKARKYVSLAR